MPIAEALRATLLELTAIPSPIGEEEAICNVVEARLVASLGRDAVQRFQHSLVVRPLIKAGVPRIGLVGHLDTVRTQHDGPARIEGDKLFGAGAADMKAGLAVMIELVERLDLEALPAELTLIFYEREEGPFAENLLGPILAAPEFAHLHDLDLAVCLEPSSNELQLGCVGSVHTTLRFHGRTAHSARPWQGENAILKATRTLALLGAREPHDVVLDGHHFHEVVSPTMASGGRQKNVVPDVFEVNVNYRFAPGRTPEDAVADIESIVGDDAEVIPTDLSPAGRPHANHPLVIHLAGCGVHGVKTKQAWTDVARFDAMDVPGVNFGPGTQTQAHQKNEWTELALVYEAYEILLRFLTTLPAVPIPSPVD